MSGLASHEQKHDQQAQAQDALVSIDEFQSRYDMKTLIGQGNFAGVMAGRWNLLVVLSSYAARMRIRGQEWTSSVGQLLLSKWCVRRSRQSNPTPIRCLYHCDI